MPSLPLALMAVASALGALAANPHPTANAASDVVLGAAFAGVVVVLGSRAPPLAAGAGVVTAAAGAVGAWALLALGPFVVFALTSAATDRLPAGRRAVVGALAGAVTVQLLVRQPTDRLATNLAWSAVALAFFVVPTWQGASTATRGRLRRVVQVAGGAVGVIVFGLAVSVLMARHDVHAGLDRAKQGAAAARRGDGERAAERLAAATAAFGSARDALDAWWTQPARLLPVIGQQARSLEVLAGAGEGLAAVAETSARTVPIDDLQVVDGRLDLELVQSMEQPLAAVRAALEEARTMAPGASSEWLLPPVADGVEEFERIVAEAIDEAETAADAVAVLPDLLGGSGRRFYFVAFGTPAETRELGGFMGAYALLTAEDGRLELATTGRVRELNELFRGGQLSEPDALPPNLVAMLPQRFWHNLTGVADFPSTAAAVHQLWPSRSFAPLDGVIYMDPATLADLLALTGPIHVPERAEPLTADTAAAFLLRDQYTEFPDDDRHDFLLEAATRVFRRLTSGELDGPAAIADALSPSVRERRLLLNSVHPAEQALFERLEIDGALPPVDGDFLSVRSSNRGLNKIDALLQRRLDYEVVADPGRAEVAATLRVALRNDAPSSGLPEAVIGDRLGEPDGTNSTTLIVYSPLALEAVTVDGEAIPWGAMDVHGRHRYSVLLAIPPGDTVTVTFALRGPMDLADGYHLDLVPQPMANPDQVAVTVRGAHGELALGAPLADSVLDERAELDIWFAPDL